MQAYARLGFGRNVIVCIVTPPGSHVMTNTEVVRKGTWKPLLSFSSTSHNVLAGIFARCNVVEEIYSRYLPN